MASVPESRSRRKKDQSVDKRTPVKIGSPRWVAPTMIALFVLGLLWVCAWYIAPDAPILSDLGFWNNAAAQEYGVTGIPYTVLVDREGKILDKGLRGEQLEQKLAELLGN